MFHVKPYVDAAELLAIASRNRGAGESLLETVRRLLIFGALEDAAWVQRDAAETLHITPRMLNYYVTGEGQAIPPNYPPEWARIKRAV